MAISNREIHSLISQGMQERYVQDTLKFEEQLNLYSNQILKIREENVYNNVRNDFILKKNELELNLRQAQDKTQTISDFETGFKSEIEPVLLGLSPEKRKSFEVYLSSQMQDLKLKSLDSDMTKERNDFLANIKMREDNLRTSILSDDPLQIRTAKEDLENQYNVGESLGIYTKETSNILKNKLGDTIYKTQVQGFLSEKESIFNDQGKEKALDFWKGLKKNKSYPSLGFKQRANIDKEIGRLEKYTDEDEVVDAEKAYRMFSMEKDSLIRGTSGMDSFSEATSDSLEKYSKILPKVKGAKRDKVKQRIKDIKNTFTTMEIASEDSGLMLSQNPQKFLEKAGLDINKKEDREAVLEMTESWLDFKKDFNNFKNKKDISDYLDFQRLNKPQGMEEPVTIDKLKEDSSNTSVNNFKESLPEELKNSERFEQEYLVPAKKIISDVSIRSTVEGHIGDKTLTKEESDLVYNNIFNLLDEGNESALEYLSLFLENGVNISSRFAKKTGIAGDSLYSHIRMLGAVHGNVANSEDYKEAYKGFVNLVSGDIDPELKKKAGQVYGKVRKYLASYMDGEGLTNLSDSEDFEGISGNVNEVNEFLSAVMTNSIIRNKDDSIVLNKDNFFDSIDNESSRYSSWYNRLKGTSDSISDRVHVPNSFVTENTEFIRGDRRFNLEETYETIGASIGERDLNLKDGDPFISRMIYTLLKHDDKIGDQISSMDDLDNIVIRDNSLFYKTGDGTQNPVVVFGNPVGLNVGAMREYQDKYFEEGRSDSSVAEFFKGLKEFLVPQRFKKFEGYVSSKPRVTLAGNIFSEGFRDTQIQIFDSFADRFDIHRQAEDYLRGPIEKGVRLQAKALPFIPDDMSSSFYKGIIKKITEEGE